MAFLQGLDSHIVIVGCGISGIGAAQKLLNQGFHNVRILEATGRCGGRIRTGRIGSKTVEIGANWIHGPCQDNPVFRLACRYDLLDAASTSEENQAVDVGGHPPYVSNWFSSSGRRLDPELTEPAAALFQSLLLECQDFHASGGEPAPSVGAYVKARAPGLAAAEWRDDGGAARDLGLATMSALLKLECSISGTPSMDDVGLGAFGAYKTLPGLDCTFPAGYEGLIGCMMKELPEGIVSYNVPVKCVHWNGSVQRPGPCGRAFPVWVECENGDAVPADHVILTVPLGYLKKHQKTLLSPPLPLKKMHCIERMGFGTNNKIFLEFEQPFWDPDCEAIHFVWEDESALVDVVPDVERFWMKKLACFTVLKPAERYGHLLCGWISGHESEHMESLSEAEVEKSVTQVIRRFTGNPTISPKRIMRSQWYHDPYTCGSYSYLATGCSGFDIDTLAEPLPLKGSRTKPLQVLFAGEATHDSFFSTVHGALLSGWREGDRIISHYSPSSFSVSVSSKL
ncbi:peroxisomal N(1)-acetyl-spermine/spermidine oxidase-like [Anguilla rostrata]|uniref:peroxisomal N(1)-acetyl-spermine/spermidine oxidase-like n=1 Tax=Anguilla rostrata TaxID=7938 RepID=UPI0030D085AE